MSPLAVLLDRIQTRGAAKPRPGAPEPAWIRAQDRRAALLARAGNHRVALFFLLAGPGVMAMVAENDGPSMLSYATTGATYGVGFFIPFVLLTFSMAFVVQELTARLGIASRRGYGKLIFERFGPAWGRFAIGDLVIGNVLTLVTEFIALCAGARYFGISPAISALLALTVAFLAFTLGRYRTWERLVIGLALGNLLFIPAAFFAHADPHAALASLVTWGPLSLAGHPGTFLTLVMATIGATVTPWMVFFQQSTVVDKGFARADMPQARLDTALGAALAAIVAVATIVAASPLFVHHVDASRFSAAEFATALRPYLGNVGSSLFALGLIEAGLVAILTISASSAYAIGDVGDGEASLNLPFSPRRLFHLGGIASAVIAAALVLVPGAPLLAITITVNVIATLLMPPALLFLLLLVNDREVVGDLKNTWYANLAGGTIVIGISLLGATYGIVTAFPNLLPK